MIPRPSALPSTILAVPPSALNVLESVFWKGISTLSAAGSHTRVVPEDFRTSTRVVTSKVRQLPGTVSSANAAPAETATTDRKKSRRFIGRLLSDILRRWDI